MAPRRLGVASDVAQLERGLLVCCQDGVIAHANDVLCRMIGVPVDRLVGRMVGTTPISSDQEQRWAIRHLPETGKGIRYLRELDTAHGRRLILVELSSVDVGDQLLILSTYEEPAAGRLVASDADILGAVVDAAPVGVAIFDRDLRILRVNTAAGRVGRLQREQIGTLLRDAVHSLDPVVVDSLQAVLDTGRPILNLETRGGDGRTLLVNMFAIFGPLGVVDAVGCVYLDVSDRVEAGRVARELAAIVTSSEDAILSEDLDGTIRSWNSGAERLYGWAAHEAIGRPITTLEPEARRGETLDILRRVASGEPVDHFETTRLHKDGSIVHVSLTVSPVRDDHGTIVAASVIAHDVSERRIAEARRSAIFDTSLDGIVTMNAAGRIVEFNPSATRIFGFERSEVVGRTVAETIVPEDQRDAHRIGLQRYLETGDGALVGELVEVTAIRRDGTRFPAEISITPVSLGDDTLFTAHIRDITHRKEAEQALVDSERHRRKILASLLQAEEEERSRIATELHDDTVQVMTAALLVMDRVAMAARRDGSSRLESAVMLARATLEEATERTRRLMFELRPAILHERGLEAALHVLGDQVEREAGAECVVHCDVERLDPAVEELVYRTVQEALANVRKHAQARHVTVTVCERSGGIEGRIDDDGRGFDTLGVRTRPRAALHLGLDSLAERVRAAGGEVRVESAPGAGTRVRFSIPLPGQAVRAAGQSPV